MTASSAIHEILIERDIAAFVAGDWDAVRPDFDADAFTGYSGASGVMRLEFPSLDDYRSSWLGQAVPFRGLDPTRLAAQLHAAQRLDRIEVSGDRALATKLFDGVVDGPSGAQRLAWTTYYFLRRRPHDDRWLITGFAGYLPERWNAR